MLKGDPYIRSELCFSSPSEPPNTHPNIKMVPGGKSDPYERHSVQPRYSAFAEVSAESLTQMGIE